MNGDVTNEDGRNLLTGDNSVVVGQPAGNFVINSYSERLGFAATNNYTGNTILYPNVYSMVLSPVYTPDLGISYYSGLSDTQVDVYGMLWLAVKGSLRASDDANTNEVVLHPGAVLRLDSYEAVSGFSRQNVADRWADNVGITLDGARLFLRGYSNGDTTETVGDILAQKNASIQLESTSTTGTVKLTVGNITRGGPGDTLTILHTGRLGDTTHFDQLYTNAPTPPTLTNGMVDPWIVSGSNTGAAANNSFVTYGANGFDEATYSAVDLALAVPTDVVDVSTSQTLSTNPDLYALRIRDGRTISTAGEFNTITIRSGGLISTGTANNIINANLVFAADGTTPSEALIFAHNRELTLYGQITAGGVTKFGDSYLNLRVDQPTYTSGWTINNGLLRAYTLGALGTDAPTNIVTLNGGNIAGTGTGQYPTLYFGAATGSTEPATYTMGGVRIVESGRIYADMGGQDDRTQIIGPIEITKTDGPGPALVVLENTRSRSTLKTGMVTIDEGTDVYLKVNNGGAAGRMSSFELGGLTATDSTVTKTDMGVLALPDISQTFNGGTLVVAGGALRALSDGSLGSATTQTTIEANGVLEIDTPEFTPIANLTQNVGSFERWRVGNARPDGHTVPDGVVIQLAADVRPAEPYTLNMGVESGIEGFEYTDDPAPLAVRTIGSNVTIQLNGMMTVGQASYMHASRPDGKAPYSPEIMPTTGSGMQGSPLVIEGTLTGTGELLKIGRDWVTLAATNSYVGDTIVDEGYLQTGAPGALSISGALTTRYSGTLDLYGFDQSVGNLGTPIGAPALLGTEPGNSGTITNSAYEIRTLTAGNALDYGYNGSITGNVALAKQGSGTLALHGVNSYIGATTINDGTLEAAADGALGGTASITVNTGATLLLSGTGTDRINDLAPITLNNGTIKSELASVVTEVFGALTLSSTNTLSIIDMGDAGGAPPGSGSVLSFADSNGQTWNGILSIYNWTGTFGDGGGTDQLFFGSSSGGLTAAQAESARFYEDAGITPIGSSGMMTASGELVPIPEPATGIAALALLALVLLRECRSRARRQSLRGA